jgi:hypothetical protein
MTCTRTDLSSGNTEASHTPPPPWELGWRKGGCMKQENLQLPMLSGLFPNSNPIAPKIFPAIWIFVRKNLAVQTFIRNFFGFFRFRTGKKLAEKISRQLFLRFSTFDRKIFRFLKF